MCSPTSPTHSLSPQDLVFQAGLPTHLASFFLRLSDSDFADHFASLEITFTYLLTYLFIAECFTAWRYFYLSQRRSLSVHQKKKDSIGDVHVPCGG